MRNKRYLESQLPPSARGDEEAVAVDVVARRPFTEYVRCIDCHCRPSDSQFEALWNALRGALRTELRRRGLWDSSPSHLGIYGWDRWDAAGASGQTPPHSVTSGPLAREEPLEELVAECYSFIFVARLRSLRTQLMLKPNVDGLVFLDIRHFLHERQKEYDPLGFRVFEVLRTAVRKAVAAGELYVLRGDSKIRNATVLGFDSGADPEYCSGVDLRDLVARWDDELLPDLVTARGQGQDLVAERLRSRLPELRQQDVQKLRFKDLVDSLKSDVRARWAAFLGQSAREVAATDEAAGWSGQAPPTRFETVQSFERLVNCVEEALKEIETDPRTSLYLSRLWQFLRIRASDAPGSPSDLHRRESILVALHRDDEHELSHRKLAELLRIPRERLPDLFRMLSSIVALCREGRRADGAGTLRVR